MSTDRSGSGLMEKLGGVAWEKHSLQDLGVGVMKDPCGWSLRGLEVRDLVEDEVTSLATEQLALLYVDWHSTAAGGSLSRLVASGRRCFSAMELVADFANGHAT